MTMEAWLSELEMEWDSEEVTILNNFYNNPSEELDIILGDDFHFSSGENSPPPIIINPDNLQNATKLSQLSPPPPPPPPPPSNIDQNNIHEQQQDLLLDNDKEDSNQANGNGNGNGKRKRKREANGAFHHIVAERKRRELHSQRFIALSALVPNLKKVDKGSILVETISYLKSLQQKVKEYEEAAASAQNVESSMVVVKTSHPVAADNDDGDDQSSGGGNNENDWSSDIEVNITNKTLILKLCCKKQKGILSKIITGVEKQGWHMLSCCVAPVGISSMHITIVAQTEMVGNIHVMKLVEALKSILRSQ